MIYERISALRSEMRKRNISIYVVPTADFHESEYVGDYFQARKYMTGFTGSAGNAVITMEEAGLWTDGRYFVQAKKQLEGSGITLFRMGEEGVPTINEYIEQNLGQGENLGFDGRVVNGRWGQKLQEIVEQKQGRILAEEDLVDRIWESRPPLSKEPAWILDTVYSGQSTADKLEAVRGEMKELGAEVHLLSSLCDIAWLLNVRGNDICHVPVVLSYLALTETECIWFVQEEILNDTLQAYLQENAVTTRPYESFYSFVEKLDGVSVLLDSGSVNHRIYRSIAESVRVIDANNPTVAMKAVKNPVEVSHVRNAHVKDGVAMCRFMYWLKKNVGSIPMTELSVSAYLAELRAKQDDFVAESFTTICGYAEHGAIVHYSATEESDVSLKPEGLLLVDSGGHYMDGTTDVTRTFVLGPISDEMREAYTRVCRANLHLMYARFLYGTTGRNLDILARQPFWEAGLDYQHGTGHGVGYLLNVHEGPNSFRWQVPADKTTETVLEEGMVTTDEPGCYLEGKFGIRLENELLCKKGEKNNYGQFMYFENLTYVPFDLDAVETQQMNEAERSWLNAYHASVYEVISPYLEGEELAWMKEATRAV